jgi:hypothetical protein
MEAIKRRLKRRQADAFAASIASPAFNSLLLSFCTTTTTTHTMTM